MASSVLKLSVEYLLREGVMSEEFEKWYVNNKSLPLPEVYSEEMKNVCLFAWQAARELDAKRIAELEAELNKLRISSLVTADAYSKSIQSMKSSIAELELKIQQFVALTDDKDTWIAKLESQNKVMREALEKLCALSGNPNIAERKYDLMWEIANRSLKDEG